MTTVGLGNKPVNPWMQQESSASLENKQVPTHKNTKIIIIATHSMGKYSLHEENLCRLLVSVSLCDNNVQ